MQKRMTVAHSVETIEPITTFGDYVRRKLDRMIVLLVLVLSVTLVPITLQAQLSTATMFGTVTDSTGAGVANATVTLVQTETNFTRITTTKTDGSYRNEFLPIGPYRVKISAPGFKTLERSGIWLAVMQNAELNLVLDLGSTNETINVSA